MKLLRWRKLRRRAKKVKNVNHENKSQGKEKAQRFVCQLPMISRLRVKLRRSPKRNKGKAIALIAFPLFLFRHNCDS